MGNHILMLLDNPFRSDFRVEKEIRSLKGVGYRITLLCTKDAALPSEEDHENVTVKRLIDNDILLKPWTGQYRTLLRGLVEIVCGLRPDFVHCHDFRMLNIGVAIKQVLPVKIVYDAHEYLRGYPLHLDAPSLLSKLKGYFVWQYLKEQEKQAINFADAIITGADHHLRRVVV